MESWPKITVVIPVRNEEKFIAETLDFILKQDYPRESLEIIVADGESDDRTVEIVNSITASDNRVRLINNPRRLSSAGRNAGIENASGEIITFIDGHTYIDNDQLLKSTARFMAEKDVTVLSRPQFLDTPFNDYMQNAISIARKSVIGHGLDSTIYTDQDKFVDPSSSGASYKTDLFNEIGKYDEHFDACEDVELNFRAAKAGYQSFTSKKLAVYYYPRNSIAGLFKQLKRYGIGRFRLFRKHPGSLSLGTLIPFGITVGFPLLAVASIFSEYLLYLLAATLGPYIIMILLWSLGVSIKNGLKYLPALPFIYLTIHTGLGYGFLVEMVRTFFDRGMNFNK